MQPLRKDSLGLRKPHGVKSQPALPWELTTSAGSNRPLGRTWGMAGRDSALTLLGNLPLTGWGLSAVTVTL